MKMVVITENGQIQGFAHGSKADHTASHEQKKDRAGLRALPGQEMHEVEVTDEIAKMEDGQEIHRELSKLMKKR
jgi:hypothetical protein